MVYYIVALHKDGVNEQQVEQMTKTEVLGVGGRMPLGELYSLQEVSIVYQFIIFLNRLTKHSSKLAQSINSWR